MTKESRALTQTQDVVVLVLLAGVLVAGFLASHPALAPFDARTLLLAHVLLGDLVLILTPLTKIVPAFLGSWPFVLGLFVDLGRPGHYVAISRRAGGQPRPSSRSAGK